MSTRTDNNTVYENIESILPDLRRYARVLAGVSGADDLVQDAVVRALSKSHLFHEGTNLRAWAFTIMRNLFISGTRRSGREGPVLDPDESGAALSVAAQQEDSVMLAEVARILPDLPEGQRRAIELVAVDGLAYEDAAAVMGLNVGTVRSRLSRGRDALRRMAGPPEREAA